MLFRRVTLISTVDRTVALSVYAVAVSFGVTSTGSESIDVSMGVVISGGGNVDDHCTSGSTSGYVDAQTVPHSTAGR